MKIIAQIARKTPERLDDILFDDAYNPDTEYSLIDVAKIFVAKFMINGSDSIKFAKFIITRASDSKGMNANCQQIHSAFKDILGQYRVFTEEDYERVKKEFLEIGLSEDQIRDVFSRYD